MQDSLDCRFRPDSYVCWREACSVLQTLTTLHSLELEIAIWYEQGHDDPDCPDDASLLAIFKALIHVRARKFEIQLNMDVPDSVINVLGDTPFKLLRYERPVDWHPSRVGY